MSTASTTGAVLTQRRLGTFGGVFVPNVLTILGVIMFLRLGWVVGQAGLVQAIVILLIAKAITLLTALSLSAISTNTEVGAGGAYFLISRSLGLEIGGAVGVPLYLAQAISVAFYLVGFAESLQLLLPSLDERVAGSAALLLFLGVAWFGAGIIEKTQYVIFVLLIASIVAIFTGWHPVADPRASLAPAYSEGVHFWPVFAIFFPAVTGIMSGVSMSGDLKDPARSIPRGTILAVLVTLVVYAAMMVWVALNADRTALKDNPLVLLDIASVPPLIYVGLWAATLSSALASLAAAPRTLKALALDKVAPTFLGRSIGRSNEPRVALVVSAVIAEACVLVGDLNLIAPIITMFFLATYGTLNIVAGVERLVSNPSFRPTFRTHWLASLIGGAGCVGVMVLISAPATVVAAVVIGGIYFHLTRRSLDTAWGDVRSGFWFSIARLGLLRYISSRQHLRNWRPIVLVLAGNPTSRRRLIEFADLIEARRGFLFISQVVTGDWSELLPRQRKIAEALNSFIREERLSAIAKVVVAEDFEQGVSTLLQVSGLGQFEPNTVMIGWSDDRLKQAMFAGAIGRILQLERNLVIFGEADTDDETTLTETIDVWWYAKENGSFMLTLAYLIHADAAWRGHRIRVLRIINNEAGAESTTASLKETIRELRVDAEVHVIVTDEPPMSVIACESRNAHLTLVGLSVQRMQQTEAPLATYAPLAAELRGYFMLAKSWHDLNY